MRKMKISELKGVTMLKETWVIKHQVLVRRSTNGVLEREVNQTLNFKEGILYSGRVWDTPDWMDDLDVYTITKSQGSLCVEVKASTIEELLSGFLNMGKATLKKNETIIKIYSKGDEFVEIYDGVISCIPYYVLKEEPIYVCRKRYAKDEEPELIIHYSNY